MADAPDPPSAAGTPKGRAPHRRDPAARQRVLQAADDLLVERGFGGVTIEGIATRAGVAKQTIYRWWSSKVDVLLDTLVDDSAAALAVPDTGSAVQDLRLHLRQVAAFVDEAPAGRVLLALIGHAQHDADMARTFREAYLAPQRDRERAMLQRGIDRGELPGDLAVDATLDALYGTVYSRALLAAQPTGPEITDALVGRLLSPGDPSRPGRSRTPSSGSAAG
jgi:AcrR family transcriptional regulator